MCITCQACTTRRARRDAPAASVSGPRPSHSGHPEGLLRGRGQGELGWLGVATPESDLANAMLWLELTEMPWEGCCDQFRVNQNASLLNVNKDILYYILVSPMHLIFFQERPMFSPIFPLMWLNWGLSWKKLLLLLKYWTVLPTFCFTPKTGSTPVKQAFHFCCVTYCVLPDFSIMLWERKQLD